MTAWQKPGPNAASWRNGENWVVILADKAFKAGMIWMKLTSISPSVHEWKHMKQPLWTWKRSTLRNFQSVIRLHIAWEFASVTWWNEKRLRWDTLQWQLVKIQVFKGFTPGMKWDATNENGSGTGPFLSTKRVPLSTLMILGRLKCLKSSSLGWGISSPARLSHPTAGTVAGSQVLVFLSRLDSHRAQLKSLPCWCIFSH